MSADGVSPFGNRISYSFWPIALSCLNLPPWMRMQLPAMWLCCIIPGPKEADDFQPVLDIIADELNALYMDGHSVTDSATQLQHTCKAKLFGLVSDYKGIGPLLRGRRGISHNDSCYECFQAGMSSSGKSSIFPGAIIVCSYCIQSEGSTRNQVVHIMLLQSVKHLSFVLGCTCLLASFVATLLLHIMLICYRPCMYVTQGR